MRYIVLSLAACLVLSGLTKADVVINSATGTGNTGIASAGEGVNYLFTTGNASLANSTTGNFWSLTSFKFFGGASHNNGDWTISLLNSSGTTTLATQSFTAATSDISGVTTFNFNSGFSSTLLDSNIQYNLRAIYNGNASIVTNINGLGSVSYDTTQTNPNAQFSGASGSGIGSGIQAGQFQLNASAVPEPGTLLLGSIAACSGAAGAWWKRRKRKATQPETTDQPATA